MVDRQIGQGGLELWVVPDPDWKAKADISARKKAERKKLKLKRHGIVPNKDKTSPEYMQLCYVLGLYREKYSAHAAKRLLLHLTGTSRVHQLSVDEQRGLARKLYAKVRG